MFSLPEKYRKDAPIAKTTFIKGAQLAGAEKKRFETAVEEIRLMYQIEGFDIPNLINDEYNCQVIMFLRIKLHELKQAAFISKIVQKNIAPLCVIELTDGTNTVYSFADKRLNKQNEKSVMIESEYLTDKISLGLDSNIKTLFSLYIDYEKILSRTNKHSYYLEMMTKAFIIFNRSLYPGIDKILGGKIWYDEKKTVRAFSLLRELKALKISAAKAKTVAEKSPLNKAAKEKIKLLEELS